MFTDARIAAGLEAMLRGIDVPPVPIARIRERIAQPPAEQRRAAGFFLAAAAALVIAASALPVVAPGFAQSIAAEIKAILR